MQATATAREGRGRERPRGEHGRNEDVRKRGAGARGGALRQE